MYLLVVLSRYHSSPFHVHLSNSLTILLCNTYIYISFIMCLYNNIIYILQLTSYVSINIPIQIDIFMYISTHLSIYLPTYLSILPIYPSVHLSIYICLYLSGYLLTYLSLTPTTNFSIILSFYLLFIYLSIDLYIYHLCFFTIYSSMYFSQCVI